MFLSLVIPSLNTREHLENMLSSLAAYPSQAPHEIIVVDMSSTDGTLEMLKSRFPEVKILEDVPNKGYGAAANAGLAVAQGTHILVCNSDLLFREASIDRIFAILGEVDDHTLLGFRLEGLDGVIQRSALSIPGPMDLVWMFSVKVRSSWRLTFRLMRYLADWDITERTPVGWVTGAALAASRTLFDKLHGFDEEFFMFSEEVDLCHRVHDLGGTVLYVPEVAITHVGGGTLSDTAQRDRLIAAGRVRYTRKHHGHVVLFVARLGATAAYLSSYPIWLVSWLRRKMTARDIIEQARRWGATLLEAWRT
jgi:GT2 family glycosyltransferase